MFFYVSLFIASLIVAVVLLHLWRAIFTVGKAVYQSFLPSTKEYNNLTSHLEKPRFISTINKVPTPWGWKGGANPAQVARSSTPAPAKPATWGWSGDDSKKRNNIHGHNGHKTDTANGSVSRNSAKEEPIVSLPYREDPTDYPGKTANKANRIEKLRKNYLKTNKPWGW